MHRSFIQPPSNGSQQQQRRRKWSHSQIGSSVYANDTKVVGIAISVAQRPRLTTPIMTEINLINSGNYINQTRQLLKHKLDDNEIETRQESHSFMNDTLPKITASPSVRAPMVQTPLSLMTHNLSSSSYVEAMPNDKLFGSTEPLAVVEVKEIFRDCNLQWTRCIVIPNENNKAPFNVSPEGDQQYIHGSQDVCQSQQKVSDEQSMTPGILDADIVKSTPSQDLHEFVEDESAEFNIDEGDSISGLHKDMSKMGVLVSSQGSVFEGSSGDFMKSQQRASTNFETGLVAIDEERDDSAPILQFLKSSQGSDDGAEEFGLNFGRRRETLGPAHKIQNIAPSVNLQCIKDLNQSDDILSINKANEHSRSSQAIVSTTTNASGLKTS
ncbi:hypothetical protein BGX20_005703 [Mortierella sp. AD010]|nr:hypothetical protein BGX20_005703 [Mortierella sp. AD010]